MKLLSYEDLASNYKQLFSRQRYATDFKVLADIELQLEAIQKSAQERFGVTFNAAMFWPEDEN